MAGGTQMPLYVHSLRVVLLPGASGCMGGARAVSVAGLTGNAFGVGRRCTRLVDVCMRQD